MRKLSSFIVILQIILLITSCASPTNITAYDIRPPLLPEQSLPYLTILDGKSLQLKRENDRPVTELSGIAWDHDEKILYAISDEGALYHLKLGIEHDHLNFVTLEARYPLFSKNALKLEGKWSDTEGLSLLHHNNGEIGDSQLVVSFENKPRIVRYTPQGRFIENTLIASKLRKQQNFQHKNKALESVTSHPTYGLITAAEFPLKENNTGKQTLYSTNGDEWSFHRFKAENSAITGLEILESGDILVLERAWSGKTRPLQIRLSVVHIDRCNAQQMCQQTVLGDFSTKDNWRLDNFEGLAALGNDTFLMVSDDNQSVEQQTLLVLFEVRLNP